MSVHESVADRYRVIDCIQARALLSRNQMSAPTFNPVKASFSLSPLAVEVG